MGNIMVDLYMYKYDKMGTEGPSDTSNYEGGQFL